MLARVMLWAAAAAMSFSLICGCELDNGEPDGSLDGIDDASDGGGDDGDAHDGDAYDGDAYDGDAYDGDAYDGDAYDGDAYDGDAYDGDAYDGDAYDGDAYDGDAYDGDASDGDASDGDDGGGDLVDPEGACCVPGGDCLITTELTCTNSSGAWSGDGTVCNAYTCVAGACCAEDGSCAIGLESSCADPVVFLPYATECSGCPPPVACCLPGGSCVDTQDPICLAMAGVPLSTDSCGDDPDSDGVFNPCDNCPAVSNPGQEDDNSNGLGDACESNDLVFPLSVTVDGLDLANHWVLAAATDDSGGMGYVVMNLDTGASYTSMNDFVILFDFLINDDADGMLVVSESGCSATCLNGSAQPNCMSHNFIGAINGTWGDYSDGFQDVWTVGGTYMINVIFGFQNPVEYWSNPNASSMTYYLDSGAQVRLAEYAPAAGNAGVVWFVDPVNTTIYALNQADGTPIADCTINTVYSGFRTAGAGRFGIAITNNGPWGGDALESDVQIYDLDACAAGPTTHTAPNGDFQGGDAIVSPDGQIWFAVGTAQDGVMLGAIDPATGQSCADLLPTGDPVWDAGLSEDGLWLVLSMGSRVEAWYLPDQAMCAP